MAFALLSVLTRRTILAVSVSAGSLIMAIIRNLSVRILKTVAVMLVIGMSCWLNASGVTPPDFPFADNSTKKWFEPTFEKWLEPTFHCGLNLQEIIHIGIKQLDNIQPSKIASFEAILLGVAIFFKR